MAKIEKFFIDDIAKLTQAMLERAMKKHKSVNAYCIFVEGNRCRTLTPEYDNEKEEQVKTRQIMDFFVRNPEICKKFAQIVMPPARFFEREAKKQAKQAKDNSLSAH